MAANAGEPDQDSLGVEWSIAAPEFERRKDNELVEYEKALRTRMEKMIFTVEAAIAKGKIG